MATDVKTATPEMGPADAAGLMASYNIGAVPIVAPDGRPLGLVTDRDLVLRVLAPRVDPAGIRLDQIATRRSLATTTPDTSVSRARAQMTEAKVKRLLVVKGDRLVGIVSLGDLAQVSASHRAVGEAVSRIFAGGRAGGSEVSEISEDPARRIHEPGTERRP